jgi:PAS domain S-box-containing protein
MMAGDRAYEKWDGGGVYEDTRGYLASILEGSADAIASIDLEGVIRSWNRGAEELLGYRAEEIIGKHYYTIIPEELRWEVEELRKKAIKEGRARAETYRLHKDGRKIPVDLTISPIKDPAGKVVGTSGVMKDLTLRKRLERELKEARDHLKSIIDTIGEEICVIDRDYNIISFNKAFARKRRSWRIAGEKCYKALHGYSYEDFTRLCRSRCPVRKAFKTGKKTVSSHVHRQRDGSIIYHESRALPSKDEEGRVYQVVYIIEDVTDKRRLEEELKRHAKELELKNRELEGFAYSVAHDLKAPLRAVEGFSTALIEDFGDRVDKDGKHYLNRIRANIRKMDALISDLLEYSKIGKTRGKYERVDVSELVRQILEDERERLREKNIRIVVGELPTTYCDRDMIARVFANLINNSIRFSSRSPVIEIGCAEKGGFYEFYVKDNGIGFNMKYKDKIFELFYRLNPEDYDGTGVGLAIVKKIVEGHGVRCGLYQRRAGGVPSTLPYPKEKGEIERDEDGSRGRRGQGEPYRHPTSRG